MSKSLKEFISQNREQLDTVEPSGNLWAKIDSGIKTPSAKPGKFSALNTLIVIVPFVALVLYFKTNTGPTETIAAKKTQQPVAVNPVENTPPATPEPGNETPKPAPQQPKVVSFLAPALFKEPLPEPMVSMSSIPVTSLAAGPLIGTADRATDGSGTWLQTGETLFIDTLFPGVKVLRVNSFDFDVNIDARPGDNLALKAEIVAAKTKGMVIGKDKYKINYNRQDTTLFITVESTSRARLVVGTLMRSKVVLDFKVPVTTDVVVNSQYGNIKAKGLGGKQCVINAGSGDVTLDQVNAPVRLVAGYGDATLSNINGDIDAKLKSGDAKITMAKGNINITSSYGGQNIKDLTGNLKAYCKSGDIKVCSMVGDASLDSDYGDVTLQDFAGMLTVLAGSGDIKGKSVKLTGNMVLNSKYGDIKMDLLNDLSELSFNLDANYGSLGIDKNGEKFCGGNKLTLNRGALLVKAHTTSGDQHYK